MDELLRFKEGRKVSLFALCINAFLAIFKISVGYLANSRAMIADGIHSASDSFSTVVVLFSLKISAKPPDSCHPYGHKRSETLAANVLALSLIISGLFIVKNNITSITNRNFFYPKAINLLAGVISILTQEITYRYSVYIGNKINSPAIIADAMHHRSDAISSVAAIIGIIAARNGFPILDPIAGIVVAGMIIHMGIEILNDTINELMEKSPDKEYLGQITKVAKRDSKVKNITNVKVRKHAGIEIIEMTITVKPDMSVREGDIIAHKVKDQLIDNIAGHEIKEVFIHVDPQRAKSSQEEVDHL